MGWNYTDFTEYYQCSGTAGLLGEKGFNITEQGTVAETDGKFGTSRGPCDTTQSGITTGFSSSVIGGTAFDTRVSQGFVRGSFVGWFRLDSSAGDQEFAHNLRVAAPSTAKQWMLRAVMQDVNPGHDGPVLFIWDHATNTYQVGAGTRGSFGSMPTGVWCMIGWSVDLALGLTRIFCGIPEEPVHFTQTAIDPAWDAFESTGLDVIAVGRNSGGSTGGINGDVDHITWTKGRFYDLQDFLNHWNGGSGLPRANYFQGNPGARHIMAARSYRARGHR